MRWGKILDIYDCPRLGYNIYNLSLCGHTGKDGFAIQDNHRHVAIRMELVRPAYDSRMRSYDFTMTVNEHDCE